MTIRNFALIVILIFLSQIIFSQDVEMQSDTSELRMIDSIGHKRMLMFVKGNKAGVVAFTPNGLSVAQLVTSSPGFSGKLVLESDSQVASLVADGGSSLTGKVPNIKLKGESTNVKLSNKENKERLKLFVTDEKSGVVLSNPTGSSVGELVTSSDGKSGKLLLENDSQLVTVAIKGGSISEASIPSMTIQADSSVVVLKSLDDNERIRLFVSKDKSGFVASNAEGNSVAQLITATNGNSGLLALDSENQEGTILAHGGAATSGTIPLIRITGDSSNFEMKDKNRNERVRLFVEDKKSGAVFFNPEGESVAQITTTNTGESGILALDNENQEATIFAQGGASSLGFIPLIRVDGDSTSIEMRSSESVYRNRLFVEGSMSGLELSDPSGLSIAKLTSTQEGDAGILSLKNDNQSTTIMAHAGSDESLTDPLFQMKGDFTKFVMEQDGELERVRLFVDDLKSGVVVFDPEGESVAQLITDPEGDYGIMALENDEQKLTIFARGGAVFDDIPPEIKIVGETSKLEFVEDNIANLSLRMSSGKPLIEMLNSTGGKLLRLGTPSLGLGQSSILELYQEDSEMVRLSTGVDGNYGELKLSGMNEKANIIASVTSVSDDLGFLGIYNELENRKVGIYATLEGNGEIDIRGENGNSNIFMAELNDPNRAYMHLANTAGAGRAGGYIGADEKGVLFAEDIVLLDPSNAIAAHIFINGSGESKVNTDIISAGVKNFKMDHPSQPGKEIWYASIEGPEAAAYVRGTGTLSNGQATIDLPKYFSEIVALQGMTVLLTPLSGKSKGMAVISKNVDQFSVVELLGGKGSYQFDWEVKAVRSGFLKLPSNTKQRKKK